MSIEIIADKEIAEISKKREVIHVCAEYNEGDPMTSEFNGKKYEFELYPCSDCGCKVKMTKGYPLMKAKKICVRCANKRAEKMNKNGDEFVGIVRESDREIYEKAQDKFIEREMKRKNMIGG